MVEAIVKRGLADEDVAFLTRDLRFRALGDRRGRDCYCSYYFARRASVVHARTHVRACMRARALQYGKRTLSRHGKCGTANRDLAR